MLSMLPCGTPDSTGSKVECLPSTNQSTAKEAARDGSIEFAWALPRRHLRLYLSRMSVQRFVTFKPLPSYA